MATRKDADTGNGDGGRASAKTGDDVGALKDDTQLRDETVAERDARVNDTLNLTVTREMDALGSNDARMRDTMERIFRAGAAAAAPQKRRVATEPVAASAADARR